MGADLLISWYEFRGNSDTEAKRLTTLLDEATDDQLWGWMESHLQIEPDEMGYTPEDVRAKFAEAITTLDGMRRDTALISLRNGYLLVGGGTSWGESTESFDLIGLLGYLGDQP
jgi:hypothetical protein